LPAEKRPEQEPAPGWSLKAAQADDGSVVITASGEFDVAAVSDVQRAIAGAATAARQPARVVVDLSQVQFLDAAMLGVLVTERLALQRGKGDLVITGVTPWALRIVEICGLRETLGL
jgi:anti-anti-sigma factor